MNPAMFLSLGDYIARRRARRERLKTYLLFTRLPPEMQSDLRRSAMFDSTEEPAV